MQMSHAATSGSPPTLHHRLRRVPALVPLVLSLAVSHACAAQLTVHGVHGAQGQAGTASAPQGGDGGAGQVVTLVLGPNGDLANSLTISGGNGGHGGAGLEPLWNDDGEQIAPGGHGGSGGIGGAANGAVFTLSGAQAGSAMSYALGGNGGNAGLEPVALWFPPVDGSAGQASSGGAATSSASAIATGAAAVTVRAGATGGNGGNSNGGWENQAGNGGSAQVQAFGKSDSGNVDVAASAAGGHGGNAAGFYKVGGAGAAVSLNNAVSGNTRGALTLSQTATAGDGGRFGSTNPVFDPTDDLSGAEARSVLTLSDAEASALSAAVAATGGRGVDANAPGAGGLGYSELTLSSTRAATVVVGKVSATGGAPGSASFSGRNIGGTAQAVATLSGLAAVTGVVTATGGDGASVNSMGGDASAQLAIVAGGLATGDVSAIGGAGAQWLPGSSDNAGAANAVLELRGNGVQGRTVARGSSASSSIRATGTGTQSVNLDAQAVAIPARFGGGLISANIEARGASGAINADAQADGASSSSFADARIDVSSAGAITGVSRAVGGYAMYAMEPIYNSGAASTARGESSAAQAVTISAIALANRSNSSVDAAIFGNASATAHGQSHGGPVQVNAEARGGIATGAEGRNIVDAKATAVSLAPGGSAKAAALAVGGYNSASARAVGTGVSAGQSGFGASAVGGYGGYASSVASSQYSEAAFALPLAGGTYITAQTSAAPATAAELPLGNNVAGSVGTLLGVGAQGAGNETGSEVFEYGPTVLQTSTGLFEFTALASQRLLIGFASSASLGGGFELLDLVILNNGVQLFAQSFTSLNAATQFFDGQVLDLGLLGAGAQQLSIASTFTFAPQSAFAFNYAVGTRVIASHAPEASTWVMMIAGLGGVLLMARRRRAAVAATSWPGSPRSASC
ncbi:MAG: PEP-CTERM sorting domain-containing protein [Duganella sp.]